MLPVTLQNVNNYRQSAGQRVVALHGQRVVALHGQRVVALHGQRVVALHGQRVVALHVPYQTKLAITTQAIHTHHYSTLDE